VDYRPLREREPLDSSRPHCACVLVPRTSSLLGYTQLTSANVESRMDVKLAVAAYVVADVNEVTV